MLLGDALSNQPREVLEGKKVIEIRLRGVSKARVIYEMENHALANAMVIAIGQTRSCSGHCPLQASPSPSVSGRRERSSGWTTTALFVSCCALVAAFDDTTLRPRNSTLGRGGLDSHQEDWAFQRAMLEHLTTVWEQPDEGIWEIRGPARQFTHSKVMAWVAFDRGIRAMEVFGLDGPVDRWRAMRRAIHRRGGIPGVQLLAG
jgi:hypothetical protein